CQFHEHQITPMIRLPSSLVLLAVVLAVSSRPTIAFSGTSDAPILTWKKVRPAVQLPARTFFASTFDPISNKVLVFGGSDASGQLDETWTFDGETWTQVQTSVTPGARAAAAMAYDSATQKVVLFGGFAGFTLLNDTWLWDGATSTWTKANPQSVPIAATNP